MDTSRRDLTNTKDLKMKFKVNKSLVSLKLVLFSFYGATACLLPYLTVHMRLIGITVEETAIIYAVLPIVGFLGPPIAGLLADRLGRYQPILVVSLIATMIFHTALLAVPPLSTQIVPLNVEFVCNHRGTIVRAQRCPTETVCPESIWSSDADDFGLQDCFQSCVASVVDLSGPLFSEICLSQEQRTHCGRFNLSTIDVILSEVSLIVTPDEDDAICQYEVNRFLVDDVEYTNMSCPMFHMDCIVKCTVTSSNSSDESNTVIGTDVPLEYLPSCEVVVGNHFVTFTSYFVVRVVAGVFLAICFTLLDATCFALIHEHKGEYGRQKLWSTLANAIFSPITGFLIDHMTYVKGFDDYSPAFYVFDCLTIFTILFSLKITFQLDNPSEKMWKNLKVLLKKVEVVSFLVMIFFLGSMWGFLETFLFWYMLDLHSPKYLLGLTVTIGSGVSIPVLFCAEKLVKKIGNMNLLISAFFIYAIRMVGYSYIQNPWWSLAFEAMEVLSIHLMWVAAATYGASVASQSLLATMQGTMGGIHYGIGRGIGSFVGGLLMQIYGTRKTFRIMGGASAIACLASLIFYLTYLRRHQKDNCKEKKANETEWNRNDSQVQAMLTSKIESNEVETII